MCKISDKIMVIFGPTASGKTALSVALAADLNAEIISADSSQIYRQINILSAKPTTDEQQGIKHHLIDFLDVCNTFSVADFVKDCKNCIVDIQSRGKNVIITGGTGLYISSLINNTDFGAIAQIDEKIVQNLRDFAKIRGANSLHADLSQIDPQSAKNIHPNDELRIIRALAHFKATGETLTDAKQRQNKSPSQFNFLKIGLEYKNREILYDRINKRTDLMLANGAVDEVQNILKLNPSQTAKNSIGINEIETYLNGEITLEQAADLIKQNTRRYAKRQITWFKREKNTHWLNMCELDFKGAIKSALKLQSR